MATTEPDESRVPSIGDVSAADLVAIGNVLALYVHLVDSREFDRLGEVFTNDAVYDFSAVRGNVVSGLPAVAAAIEALPPPASHLVASSYFPPGASADRVEVVSKYLARLENRTVIGGVYRDEARRTASGWRIAVRTLE